MSGYAKLFSEIVDSSIWDESPETCKVFITLLALADQDGYVRGSDGWLAGKSRVSLGKCVLALRKFRQPDLRSRTPDNEGRRIEQLPDCWLILNYIAFRDRLSSDPKATATRERVRKHRERYRALHGVTSGDSASASVQRERGTGERGNGLSGADKVALDKSLDRAIGRLADLRRGDKGPAEADEIKKLKATIEVLKLKLDVPA